MICTDWYEKIEDRSNRIDTLLDFMVCGAGCDILEKGNAPSFTLEEIADFVGCDIMVIKKAEQSALSKLRSKNPELKLYSQDP
tara:strand:- start:342 stop:590 length:249 start_codon:yes stop_codon:yes gene_type:complete